MDIQVKDLDARTHFISGYERKPQQRNACFCGKRWAAINIGGVAYCDRCFKKWQKENKWKREKQEREEKEKWAMQEREYKEFLKWPTTLFEIDRQGHADLTI